MSTAIWTCAQSQWATIKLSWELNPHILLQIWGTVVGTSQSCHTNRWPHLFIHQQTSVIYQSTSLRLFFFFPCGQSKYQRLSTSHSQRGLVSSQVRWLRGQGQVAPFILPLVRANGITKVKVMQEKAYERQEAREIPRPNLTFCAPEKKQESCKN